jgi:hypothetical protein
MMIAVAAAIAAILVLRYYYHERVGCRSMRTHTNYAYIQHQRYHCAASYRDPNMRHLSEDIELNIPEQWQQIQVAKPTQRDFDRRLAVVPTTIFIHDFKNVRDLAYTLCTYTHIHTGIERSC